MPRRGRVRVGGERRIDAHQDRERVLPQGERTPQQAEHVHLEQPMGRHRLRGRVGRGGACTAQAAQHRVSLRRAQGRIRLALHFFLQYSIDKTCV